MMLTGAAISAALGAVVSYRLYKKIADEAIRRGLVSNISQRSVGRFLKKRPTLNRIAFVTG